MARRRTIFAGDPHVIGHHGPEFRLQPSSRPTRPAVYRPFGSRSAALTNNSLTGQSHRPEIFKRRTSRGRPVPIRGKNWATRGSAASPFLFFPNDPPIPKMSVLLTTPIRRRRNIEDFFFFFSGGPRDRKTGVAKKIPKLIFSATSENGNLRDSVRRILNHLHPRGQLHRP